MKKLPKQPIICELEKSFGIFNENLFGGKLKIPTMRVQADKKVIFKFTPESFSFIIGGKFAHASLEEIYESLLHEMVHISNFLKGDMDCTSNQYHNRKFLNTALFIGLYVLRHKTRGWGVTKFGPKSKGKGVETPEHKAVKDRDHIVNQINFDLEILKSAQAEIRKTLKIRGNRKICFLKYECGCDPPHNSIRSGRRPNGSYPLSAICGVCQKEFKCVEGQE